MFDQYFIELKSAKRVYIHENYLILQGNDFLVCKTDGTTILRYQNMPNVYKVAFLSQDRLLICIGGIPAYRLLCLKTGEEIWKSRVLKTAGITGPRFAVSHDSRYVYDRYDGLTGHHIVRIDVQSGKLQVCKLGPGYRALDDIICGADSEGLFLLRSQIDGVADRNIGRNQIQRLTFSSPCCYETIYQWETEGHGDCIANWFLGDQEAVLSKNLSVFTPKTGETYSLVENEPDWAKPGLGPHDYWIDESNQYVCVAYDNVNVVLDRKNQKMVARYATKFGRGCLIGDTYWVPLGDKVEKKAFPMIEDIPKRKLSTW